MVRENLPLYVAITWLLLFATSVYFTVQWLTVLLTVSLPVMMGPHIYRHIMRSATGKAQYLKKIENRKSRSVAEFAQEYFPTYEQSIVLVILKTIENWASVPVDRLMPTDHIVTDLTIGVWDGLEPNHLIADIGDACNMRLDDCWLEECSGELNDFIERCYKEILRQQQHVN